MADKRGSQARSVLTSLHGGQCEEDGGGAKEDCRRGEPFRAEEVSEDSEADAERAEGGVGVPAEEHG